MVQRGVCCRRWWGVVARRSSRDSRRGSGGSDGGVGGLELNLLKTVFSSFARRSFPAAPPPSPLEAGDLLHPTPDVPGVVVLQFVLQFSSEVVLALPDAALELPLYPFEFCSS